MAEGAVQQGLDTPGAAMAETPAEAPLQPAEESRLPDLQQAQGQLQQLAGPETSKEPWFVDRLKISDHSYEFRDSKTGEISNPVAEILFEGLLRAGIEAVRIHPDQPCKEIKVQEVYDFIGANLRLPAVRKLLKENGIRFRPMDRERIQTEGFGVLLASEHAAKAEALKEKAPSKRNAEKIAYELQLASYLEPQNAERHRALAKFHLIQGHASEAALALLGAYRLHPEDRGLLEEIQALQGKGLEESFEKAQGLIAVGKKSEACEVLKVSLKTQGALEGVEAAQDSARGHAAEARLLLGQSLESLGRKGEARNFYQAAERDFQKRIKSDPFDPENYWQAHQAAQGAGQHAAAYRYLDRIREAHLGEWGSYREFLLHRVEALETARRDLGDIDSVKPLQLQRVLTEEIQLKEALGHPSEEIRVLKESLQAFIAAQAAPVTEATAKGSGPQASPAPANAFLEAKALISPLLDPILHDEQGQLDLSKIPAKDFKEFKKFLLDQASIDGMAFNDWASQGVHWKGVWDSYARILNSPEYEPVLALLFAEIHPELREESGEKVSDAMLEVRLKEFGREILSLSTDRFAGAHLDSKEGRERIRRILGDSSYDPQLRTDLIRSIARAKAEEGDCKLFVHHIRELTSTFDAVLFSVNVHSWGMKEGDLEAATRHALRILETVDESDAFKKQRLGKYREHPEKVNLLDGISLEELKSHAALTEAFEDQLATKSDKSDPRSKLRSKLAGLWLMAADRAHWGSTDIVGSNETRSYLLQESDRFLKRLEQVRSGEEFQVLSAEVRQFLKNPPPKADSAVSLKVDAFLEEHLEIQTGLNDTIEDLVKGMGSAEREPFDALLKFTDEIWAAKEMGEVFHLERKSQAEEPQVLEAANQFIQGLEEAKRKLWYGYKQQGTVSRGLSQSAEAIGNEGAVSKIRAGNAAIDEVIAEAQKAKTPEELKQAYAKLYEQLKDGGKLHQAFKAAEMDGTEQLIGLGQSMALTLAISAVTEGAGGVNIALKAISNAGKVSKAMKGVSTAAKVAKGFEQFKKVHKGLSLARSVQKTADAAKILSAGEKAIKGFKLGAQISSAENLSAKLSGQLQTEPQTILEWVKASIATGASMALTAPLGEGAEAEHASKPALKKLWQRYTKDLSQGALHLAKDTVSEVVEEVVDAYVKANLDGNFQGLSWDEFRDIATLCIAGGGAEKGLSNVIIGGGKKVAQRAVSGLNPTQHAPTDSTLSAMNIDPSSERGQLIGQAIETTTQEKNWKGRSLETLKAQGKEIEARLSQIVERLFPRAQRNSRQAHELQATLIGKAFLTARSPSQVTAQLDRWIGSLERISQGKGLSAAERRYVASRGEAYHGRALISAFQRAEKPSELGKLYRSTIELERHVERLASQSPVAANDNASASVKLNVPIEILQNHAPSLEPANDNGEVDTASSKGHSNIPKISRNKTEDIAAQKGAASQAMTAVAAFGSMAAGVATMLLPGQVQAALLPNNDAVKAMVPAGSASMVSIAEGYLQQVASELSQHAIPALIAGSLVALGFLAKRRLGSITTELRKKPKKTKATSEKSGSDASNGDPGHRSQDENPKDSNAEKDDSLAPIPQEHQKIAELLVKIHERVESVFVAAGHSITLRDLLRSVDIVAELSLKRNLMGVFDALSLVLPGQIEALDGREAVSNVIEEIRSETEIALRGGSGRKPTLRQAIRASLNKEHVVDRPSLIKEIAKQQGMDVDLWLGLAFQGAPPGAIPKALELLPLVSSSPLLPEALKADWLLEYGMPIPTALLQKEYSKPKDANFFLFEQRISHQFRGIARHDIFDLLNEEQKRALYPDLVGEMGPVEFAENIDNKNFERSKNNYLNVQREKCLPQLIRYLETKREVLTRVRALGQSLERDTLLGKINRADRKREYQSLVKRLDGCSFALQKLSALGGEAERRFAIAYLNSLQETVAPDDSYFLRVLPSIVQKMGEAEIAFHVKNSSFKSLDSLISRGAFSQDVAILALKAGNAESKELALAKLRSCLDMEDEEGKSFALFQKFKAACALADFKHEKALAFLKKMAVEPLHLAFGNMGGWESSTSSLQVYRVQALEKIGDAWAIQQLYQCLSDTEDIFAPRAAADALTRLDPGWDSDLRAQAEGLFTLIEEEQSRPLGEAQEDEKDYLSRLLGGLPEWREGRPKSPWLRKIQDLLDAEAVSGRSDIMAALARAQDLPLHAYLGRLLKSASPETVDAYLGECPLTIEQKVQLVANHRIQGGAGFLARAAETSDPVVMVMAKQGLSRLSATDPVDSLGSTPLQKSEVSPVLSRPVEDFPGKNLSVAETLADLKSGTKKEKLAALRKLEFLEAKGPEVVDGLSTCLETGEQALQEFAVRLLSALGKKDPRAIAVLRAFICGSAANHLRCQAIQALVDLGNKEPATAAALTRLLDQDAGSVWSSALAAIRRLSFQDAETLTALKNQAKRPYPEVPRELFPALDELWPNWDGGAGIHSLEILAAVDEVLSQEVSKARQVEAVEIARLESGVETWHETNAPLKAEARAELKALIPRIERMTLVGPTAEALKGLIAGILSNTPVYLSGATGLGKNALIRYLANKTGTPLYRINFGKETDDSQLYGHFEIEIFTDAEGRKQKRVVVKDGKMVEAMKVGGWCLWDEANLANEAFLVAQNDVLQSIGSGRVWVKQGGKLLEIEVDPHFRLFATGNPESYASRKPNEKSFISRWLKVAMREFRVEEQQAILQEEYSDLDPESVIHIPQALQVLKTSSGSEAISLRTLKRTARRVLESKEILWAQDLQNQPILTEAGMRAFVSAFEAEVLDGLNEEPYRNAKEALEKAIPRGERKIDDYLEEAPDKIVFDREIQEYRSDLIAQGLTPQDHGGEDLVPVPTTLRYAQKVLDSLKRGDNVLLEGPPAMSKSAIPKWISKLLGQRVIEVTGSADHSAAEMVGMPSLDAEGNLVFQPGYVLEAIKAGSILVINEANLIPAEVLERLNSLLDDDRMLMVTENGAKLPVKADSKFRLVFTQNQAELRGGRRRHSPALENKFRKIVLRNEFKPEELEQIVAETMPDLAPAASAMVEMHREAAKLFAAEGQILTLRDLQRWGGIAMAFGAQMSMSPGDAVVAGAELVYSGRTSREDLRDKLLIPLQKLQEGVGEFRVEASLEQNNSLRQKIRHILGKEGVIGISDVLKHLAQSDAMGWELWLTGFLRHAGEEEFDELRRMLGWTESRAEKFVIDNQVKAGMAFLRGLPVTPRRLLARVQLGDYSGLDRLFDKLQSSVLRNPFFDMVFETLAGIANPRILEFFEANLGGDDSDLKQASARALGNLGIRTALPKLRPLLKDPHPEVRLNAAEAMARLGDSRGQAYLRSQLDPAISPSLSPDEKDKVIHALGRLKDPQVLQPLLHQLIVNRSEEAAAALGNFEGIDILALEDALEAKNSRLRLQAAQSLLRQSSPAAYDTLVDLLSSPNAYIKFQAAKTLAQVEGAAKGHAWQTLLQIEDLDFPELLSEAVRQTRPDWDCKIPEMKEFQAAFEEELKSTVVSGDRQNVEGLPRMLDSMKSWSDITAENDDTKSELRQRIRQILRSGSGYGIEALYQHLADEAGVALDAWLASVFGGASSEELSGLWEQLGWTDEQRLKWIDEYRVQGGLDLALSYMGTNQVSGIHYRILTKLGNKSDRVWEALDAVLQLFPEDNNAVSTWLELGFPPKRVESKIIQMLQSKHFYDRNVIMKWMGESGYTNEELSACLVAMLESEEADRSLEAAKTLIHLGIERKRAAKAIVSNRRSSPSDVFQAAGEVGLMKSAFQRKFRANSSNFFKIFAAERLLAWGRDVESAKQAIVTELWSTDPVILQEALDAARKSGLREAGIRERLQDLCRHQRPEVRLAGVQALNTLFPGWDFELKRQWGEARALFEVEAGANLSRSANAESDGLEDKVDRLRPWKAVQSSEKFDSDPRNGEARWRRNIREVLAASEATDMKTIHESLARRNGMSLKAWLGKVLKHSSIESLEAAKRVTNFIRNEEIREWALNYQVEAGFDYLAQGFNGTHYSEQRNLASLMGRVDNKNPIVIQKLIEDFRSPDSQVRQNATLCLGLIGVDQAEVHQALSMMDHSKAAIASIRLGLVGQEKLVSVITSLDSDLPDQEMAIDALVKAGIRDPQLRETIIQRIQGELNTKYDFGASASLLVLVKLNASFQGWGERAQAILNSSYTEHVGTIIRCRAAAALAKHGIDLEFAKSILLKSLEDNDYAVSLLDEYFPNWHGELLTWEVLQPMIEEELQKSVQKEAESAGEELQSKVDQLLHWDSQKQYPNIYSGKQQELFTHIPGPEKLTLIGPTVEALKALVAGIVSNTPVYLSGATGLGKNALIRYLANKTGTPLYRINFGKETDDSQLYGHFEIEIFTDAEGKKQKRVVVKDGKMVEAMKVGGWCLWDEVNLANEAFLVAQNDVLQSIKSGKVWVKQGGKQVEITVQPHFRLFATGNPDSYASRKPTEKSFGSRWLEHGMREFRVEEQQAILQEEYPDLAPESVIHIPQALHALKTASGSEAISLRTLKRTARRILESKEALWAKDLEDKPILTEAGMRVFVSALEAEVLDGLSEEAYRNAKQALEKAIPRGERKIDNYLDLAPDKRAFDGEIQDYQKSLIAQGLTPQDHGGEALVPVPTTLRYAQKVLDSLKRGDNVLLEGPPAMSKSAIPKWIGKLLGQKVIEVTGSADHSAAEMVGMPTLDAEGNLVFQPGYVLDAIKSGSILVINEANLIPAEVLERLNSLLDDDKMLMVTENGAKLPVKADSKFRLVFTQNQAELRGGRRRQSPALENKFRKIVLREEFKPEELERIVSETMPQLAPAATAMVQMHQEAAKVFAAEGKTLTLRDLQRWGGIAMAFATQMAMKPSEAILAGAELIYSGRSAQEEIREKLSPPMGQLRDHLPDFSIESAATPAFSEEARDARFRSLIRQVMESENSGEAEAVLKGIGKRVFGVDSLSPEICLAQMLKGGSAENVQEDLPTLSQIATHLLGVPHALIRWIFAHELSLPFELAKQAFDKQGIEDLIKNRGPSMVSDHFEIIPLIQGLASRLNEAQKRELLDQFLENFQVEKLKTAVLSLLPNSHVEATANFDPHSVVEVWRAAAMYHWGDSAEKAKARDFFKLNLTPSAVNMGEMLAALNDDDARPLLREFLLRLHTFLTEPGRIVGFRERRWYQGVEALMKVGGPEDRARILHLMPNFVTPSKVEPWKEFFKVFDKMRALMSPAEKSQLLESPAYQTVASLLDCPNEAENIYDGRRRLITAAALVLELDQPGSDRWNKAKALFSGNLTEFRRDREGIFASAAMGNSEFQIPAFLTRQFILADPKGTLAAIAGFFPILQEEIILQLGENDPEQTRKAIQGEAWRWISDTEPQARRARLLDRFSPGWNREFLGQGHSFSRILREEASRPIDEILQKDKSGIERGLEVLPKWKPSSGASLRAAIRQILGQEGISDLRGVVQAMASRLLPASNNVISDFYLARLLKGCPVETVEAFLPTLSFGGMSDHHKLKWVLEHGLSVPTNLIRRAFSPESLRDLLSVYGSSLETDGMGLIPVLQKMGAQLEPYQRKEALELFLEHFQADKLRATVKAPSFTGKLIAIGEQAFLKAYPVVKILRAHAQAQLGDPAQKAEALKEIHGRLSPFNSNVTERLDCLRFAGAVEPIRRFLKDQHRHLLKQIRDLRNGRRPRQGDEGFGWFHWENVTESLLEIGGPADRTLILELLPQLFPFEFYDCPRYLGTLADLHSKMEAEEKAAFFASDGYRLATELMDENSVVAREVYRAAESPVDWVREKRKLEYRTMAAALVLESGDPRPDFQARAREIIAQNMPAILTERAHLFAQPGGTLNYAFCDYPFVTKYLIQVDPRAALQALSPILTRLQESVILQLAEVDRKQVLEIAQRPENWNHLAANNEQSKAMALFDRLLPEWSQGFDGQGEVFERIFKEELGRPIGEADSANQAAVEEHVEALPSWSRDQNSDQGNALLREKILKILASEGTADDRGVITAAAQQAGMSAEMYSGNLLQGASEETVSKALPAIGEPSDWRRLKFLLDHGLKIPRDFLKHLFDLNNLSKLSSWETFALPLLLGSLASKLDEAEKQDLLPKVQAYYRSEIKKDIAEEQGISAKLEAGRFSYLHINAAYAQFHLGNGSDKKRALKTFEKALDSKTSGVVGTAIALAKFPETLPALRRYLSQKKVWESYEDTHEISRWYEVADRVIEFGGAQDRALVAELLPKVFDQGAIHFQEQFFNLTIKLMEKSEPDERRSLMQGPCYQTATSFISLDLHRHSEVACYDFKALAASVILENEGKEGERGRVAWKFFQSQLGPPAVPFALRFAWNNYPAAFKWLALATDTDPLFKKFFPEISSLRAENFERLLLKDPEKFRETALLDIDGWKDKTAAERSEILSRHFPDWAEDIRGQGNVFFRILSEEKARRLEAIDRDHQDDLSRGLRGLPKLGRLEDTLQALVPGPEKLTLVGPTVEALKSLTAGIMANMPVYLSGATGLGKNALIRHLANKTGTPLYRINFGKETDDSQLYGHFEIEIFTDAEGKKQKRVVVKDGKMVEAMKVGGWCLWDEVNLANEAFLVAQNDVLQSIKSGKVWVKQGGKQVEITVHPHFRLFATGNPESYASRKPTEKSFGSRWLEHAMREFRVEEQQAILQEEYPDLAPESVIHIPPALHALKTASGSEAISLRTLKRTARRILESKEILWAQDLENKPILTEAGMKVFVSALEAEVLDGLNEESYRNAKEALEKAIPRGERKIDDYLDLAPDKKVFDRDIKDYQNSLTSMGLNPQNHGGEDLVPVPTTLRYAQKVLDSLKRGDNVLLEGPPAMSKSAIPKWIGKLLGQKVIEVTGSADHSAAEMVGMPSLDAEGNLVFQPGYVLDAIKSGSILVINEANLIPAEVLERLNSLLDDDKMLMVTENGAKLPVKADSKFRLVFTQNQAELRGGRRRHSPALENKFRKIVLRNNFKPEEKKAIVADALQRKLQSQRIASWGTPPSGNLPSIAKVTPTPLAEPSANMAVPPKMAGVSSVKPANASGSLSPSGRSMRALKPNSRRQATVFSPKGEADSNEMAEAQKKVEGATAKIQSEVEKSIDAFMKQHGNSLSNLASLVALKRVRVLVDTSGETDTASMDLDTGEMRVNPIWAKDLTASQIAAFPMHEGGHSISAVDDGFFFENKIKHLLGNCVEDPRVNNYVLKRLPGAQMDFSALYTEFFPDPAKMAESGDKGKIKPLGAYPHEQFAYGLIDLWANGRVTERVVHPEARAALERLKPITQEIWSTHPDLFHPRQKDKNAAQKKAFDLTKEHLWPVYEKLYQEAAQQLDQELKEGKGGGKPGSGQQKSGRGGSSIDPKDLSEEARKILEERAGQMADQLEPKGQPSQRKKEIDRARRNAERKAGEAGKQGQKSGSPDGKQQGKAGEGGYNEGAFRPYDKKTFADVLADRAKRKKDQQAFYDEHPYRRYFDPIRDVAKQVAESIKQIFKLDSDFEFEGHYRSGSRLDVRKAIQVAIQNQAGIVSEDDFKIFLRKRFPTKPSHDWVLMLDSSGSMKGEAQAYALQAIALFQSVLDQIKGGYAVGSFSDVAELHKDFNEEIVGEKKLDELMQELESTGGGGTNDLEGLKLAQDLIADGDAHEKTVIVVTDGAGVDSARQQILAMQERGIRVIGIGIGPGMEALKNVYDDFYISPDFKDLPKVLLGIMLKRMLSMQQK